MRNAISRMARTTGLAASAALLLFSGLAMVGLGAHGSGTLARLAPVVAAKPALAATACFQYTCDNTDPPTTYNQNTGVTCSNGAYTVAPKAGGRIQADGGTLELRWGPPCSTNWARFTPNSSGTFYYIWAGRQNPGYNVPGYEFQGVAGVGFYSNELYSPGPARACVLEWNGSQWTNQVCTIWL